jgi:hypothetical protein
MQIVDIIKYISKSSKNEKAITVYYLDIIRISELQGVCRSADYVWTVNCKIHLKVNITKLIKRQTALWLMCLIKKCVWLKNSLV